VYPTHNFFAGCIKEPPIGYVAAAGAVRREFESACKQNAAAAGRILTRDLALIHREVVVADLASNAATDRRRVRGPPPLLFAARARRTVLRDLATLDRLARC
jgi:hypothetical protein